MIRALIVCIFVFLLSTEAYGYTAVLKNGKKVQGAIVFEDAREIRLRDRDGVEITIREDQLDSEATVRINEEEKKLIAIEQESKQQRDSVVPDSDLPKIARETKSARTGKGKVWKKEDLKDLPEITVMGADISIAEEIVDSSAMADIEETERSWKEASLEIYGRLLHARQKFETLQKQCDELSLAAGFATDYALQNSPILGSPVIGQAAETCERMERAYEELGFVEEEMLLLEEDARRKGIPPGWVDPLRN